MGSFAQDIHPFRTRRAEFTRRLLGKVDREWTRVVAVAGARNPPGDVLRCRIGDGTFRCDYAPVHLDKARIRALLRAWGRQISDRYLDLQLVQRLHNRRHQSVDSAFDILRRNAPAGAVQFIMNEVERNNSPHFFGTGLWDGWGYNEYFSALLHWDDRHAYGLVNELRREEGRFGAGGTPAHIWAAAPRWLAGNQNRGIYRSTGVQVR